MHGGSAGSVGKDFLFAQYGSSDPVLRELQVKVGWHGKADTTWTGA